MNFTNKELILFDLDGTLIDSVPDLALSVNHALSTLNLPTYTEDKIRTWIGNGALSLVQRALSNSMTVKDDLDDTLSKKALDIFFEFYKKNLSVSTTLYPNVKEGLAYLHEKDYILAIVTNKPYRFVEPILKSLEVNEYFSYIVGADSLAEKKPSPLPLIHVCDYFDIEIKSSIMIGDSKNDIQAANNANMESIAVTYGYDCNEDISIYKPTVIVDSFLELQEVF